MKTKHASGGRPNLVRHAAFVAAVAALLAGLAPAQITPTGGVGAYPDLALDRFGNLHLAYARNRITYYRALVPSTGAIGAEETPGVGASRDHQYQPDVAADSKGVVHILGNAHYNTKTAAGWGTATRPRNLSRDHHMAIDANDNVWIVYRGAHLAVSQRKAGKTTWEPRVGLFSDGTSNHVYPDIAAGSDGTVHVVFRAYGAAYMRHYDCGYVRFDGTSWGSAEWVCNHSGSKVYEAPHVAMDRNDVPWVSWPEGPINVAHRGTPSTWTRVVRTGIASARDEPTIGIDRAGNKVVCTYGGRYLVYNATTQQWTAGTIQPTTPGQPIGFVDVVGSKRGCFVVWEQGAGVDKHLGANPNGVDLVVAKIMPDGSVVPFTTNENPRLAADVSAISASAGGTVNLTLDAHWAHAGREYVIGAGVSGSSPGVALAGSAVLPLNPDPITFLVFSLTFTAGPFDQLYGLLDADGGATPSLALAPGLTTSLIGAKLTFAGFLMPADYATNAVEVTIDP